MEGLEFLLEQQDRVASIVDRNLVKKEQSTIQTADKGASLFDLVKMISRLVTLTMGDLKVEFIPDEGRRPKLEPETTIDHPFITYKVIHRKPKSELKPRTRETISEKSEDTGDERMGEISGQKFKCLVQFNVFASVYETAEEVMERFEELIFMYTGHFKRSGVAEVIFDQQLTDSSYDIFRQTMSVRNIQYYIEIEKLTVVFKEKIKEIETYLIKS